MKKGFLVAAPIFLVLLLAMSSAASEITFELNFEYTDDGTEPGGEIPWLTAVFDDTDQKPNTVKLTMAATNLIASEFVGKWFFNMDDTVVTDPFLVFTNLSGPAPPPSFGLNNQNAAGAQGAGFDILFDFPQSNGNRFGSSEPSVYQIELQDGSTSTLNAESFNFTNEGGNFLSAAHVQGIGPSGDDIGWIAATGTTDIPEAASVLSLGLGILGIGLIASRKRFR